MARYPSRDQSGDKGTTSSIVSIAEAATLAGKRTRSAARGSASRSSSRSSRATEDGNGKGKKPPRKQHCRNGSGSSGDDEEMNNNNGKDVAKEKAAIDAEDEGEMETDGAKTSPKSARKFRIPKLPNSLSQYSVSFKPSRNQHGRSQSSSPARGGSLRGAAAAPKPSGSKGSKGDGEPANRPKDSSQDRKKGGKGPKQPTLFTLSQTPEDRKVILAQVAKDLADGRKGEVSAKLQADVGRNVSDITVFANSLCQSSAFVGVWRIWRNEKVWTELYRAAVGILSKGKSAPPPENPINQPSGSNSSSQPSPSASVAPPSPHSSNEERGNSSQKKKEDGYRQAAEKPAERPSSPFFLCVFGGTRDKELFTQEEWKALNLRLLALSHEDVLAGRVREAPEVKRGWQAKGYGFLIPKDDAGRKYYQNKIASIELQGGRRFKAWSTEELNAGVTIEVRSPRKSLTSAFLEEFGFQKCVDELLQTTANGFRELPSSAIVKTGWAKDAEEDALVISFRVGQQAWNRIASLGGFLCALGMPSWRACYNGRQIKLSSVYPPLKATRRIAERDRSRSVSRPVRPNNVAPNNPQQPNPAVQTSSSQVPASSSEEGASGKSKTVTNEEDTEANAAILDEDSLEESEMVADPPADDPLGVDEVVIDPDIAADPDWQLGDE